MAINSNFRTLSADNMEGVVYARNYLKNSFENNSTLGWNKVSVASMVGSLPDPTSPFSPGFANTVTTFTTSNISPLSGKYSLNVASSGSWAAGQGFISDAFTIDRMDNGKVLTISFDYEVVSGASNANFSGTLGSQTFMVYVWDTTGGAWIQPAGFLGMNQSIGPGRVSCTFQSSMTSGQQYRVMIVASVASTGAISLRFDNFTCSRQSSLIGATMLDFRDMGSMTIGGSTSSPAKGTVVTDKVFMKREGDSARLRYYYRQSAASANGGNGNYLFSLPSGMSFDSTKINITGNLDNNIGTFNGRYGGGIDHYDGYACAINSTQFVVYLQYQRESGAAQGAGILGSSIGTLSAAGDMIYVIDILAPISGWSSNVQISSSTDTRIVAASYAFTADKAVTSGVAIPFDTTFYDTHSVVSLAQGRFTAPVSGIYRMSVTGLAKSGAAGNTLSIWKNGSVFRSLVSFYLPDYAISGSASISLNAGDYIDFRVDGNFTIRSGLMASIERLSGPSVVAASESVIAKYQTTSNAVGTAATLVIYATKEIDTHGMYNGSTGVLTIPVSGKYIIGIYGTTVAGNWTSNMQFLLQLRKNGVIPTPSLVVSQIRAQTAWNTGTLEAVGNIFIDCLAGDTIEILAQNSLGVQLSGTSGRNYFYIARLGN